MSLEIAAVLDNYGGPADIDGRKSAFGGLVPMLK